MSSIETVLFNSHPTIGHAISRVLNLGIRRPMFNSVVITNTSARPHECYSSVMRTLPFWQMFREHGVELLGYNRSFETSRDYVVDKHGMFVFHKIFNSDKKEFVTLDKFKTFILDGITPVIVGSSMLNESFVFEVSPHIVEEHERVYGSKSTKSNGLSVKPIEILIIGWTSWWKPDIDVIDKILNNLNVKVELPELTRKINDFKITFGEPIHQPPFLFCGCPIDTDEQKRVIVNKYVPVNSSILLRGDHLTYIHVKYQNYSNLLDMLPIVKSLIKLSAQMLIDEINVISIGSTIRLGKLDLFLITLIQFINFSYEKSYGNFEITSVKIEHKDKICETIRDYIKLINNMK